eukprot:CAMPEP_0173378912 /NCGR_PEP_ID=MMETSP1356-20130122/2019_1 /TAXON_ID=77927 ORGANISM="Hemiselmis virescens, Strain PCC157" /NCGR_SAMPLE_ID=MMETSP1356 /ASSEMBLY_ACC=CAM_ASM_000847 /LENGTH=695 /DNA_ID=CAMNT_0014332143 /DNA_START=57 /DNA_END=2144 /DNA_ORIENTATION=-
MSYDPQVCSVVSAPAENPNESPIRRSNLISDRLITSPFPDEPAVNTVAHCMQRSADKFASNNCLGHRPIASDGTAGDYVWDSYADVWKHSVEIGLGMVELCGLSFKSSGEGQARLGIYTVNRPDALKMLMGAFSQRITACPLYDTLGPNAAGYIIGHAEITTVACERTKLKSLLSSKKGSSPLKFVILFEEATDAERSDATSAGCTLITLSEITQAGAALQQGPTLPTPEDWAYVMYTSGTTGEPKGVILSHCNFLSSASGLLLGNQEPLVQESDVYISYLPMAHSFDPCLQFCMVSVGGAIGYSQGDPKKLVGEGGDLSALKPTVMAGVPRVFSRVYDKVMQGLEAKGKFAQLLFDIAISNQSWCMSLGFRNPIWDAILFSKVREALGGRVRVLASGAAPLSGDLHRFLKVVFGCPVCQGYGMTENAAPAVSQTLTYKGTGNVGGPVPCTEVKLVGTDDYKVTDIYPANAEAFEAQVSFKGEFDESLAGKVVQRGEVCLRGTNVFVGYFKMEKETAEAKDKDGWLHTGDIGMWNPDGALQIIDRKKNIFKLSQGEYVAPESIEAACTPSKFVSQVFVYGNSLEPCTVAIVVPDKDVIMPFAASKGIRGSMKDVCASAEIKKVIYDDMKLLATASGVKGYEMPKDIWLEGEINALGQGFNAENDCLTPTLKMKRPQLQKRYQSQIDTLYANIKKK